MHCLTIGTMFTSELGPSCMKDIYNLFLQQKREYSYNALLPDLTDLSFSFNQWQHYTQ